MTDSEQHDDDTTTETWIGVVSLLPDGERFALAWVRRRDEWLADAATATRGNEVAQLARMYLEAVATRGHPPNRLNVRAVVHVRALGDIIGTSIPIDGGFDSRAEALSDAAASAIDIAFDAMLDASQPYDIDTGYDPERTPDPSAWLEMDEPERHRRIRSAHLGTVEMRGKHLQLHAGMHDAVETQLALDDPPESAATVARLQSEGLSRHDAVHAIAGVLIQQMNDMLATSSLFDLEQYVAGLRALNTSKR